VVPDIRRWIGRYLKKKPGYFRISWVSPETKLTPKAKHFSKFLIFLCVLNFGFGITFDQIKREASNLNENVRLDELCNFDAGL